MKRARSTGSACRPRAEAYVLDDAEGHMIGSHVAFVAARVLDAGG